MLFFREKYSIKLSFNYPSTYAQALGSGASGQVFMATHKVTGKKYACKKIKKDDNMNDLQSMITEIEILKRIRHRYIVSVYEIYEVTPVLLLLNFIALNIAFVVF